MKISMPDAVFAHVVDGHAVIRWKSGMEIRFPVIGNHRLAKGSEQELNHIEISHFGIHWPDLDEDLSFEGLLNGDYGQYRSREGRPFGHVAEERETYG
jgi:hypothetical protein